MKPGQRSPGQRMSRQAAPAPTVPATEGPGPFLDGPGVAFPAWVVALGRRREATTACRDLQARHGLDANLLLFVIWLALQGQRLGDAPASAADGLARLAREAREWHAAVVRPLRASRTILDRRWAGLPQPVLAGLARRIDAASRQAEDHELTLLQQAAGRLSGSAANHAGPAEPAGTLAWRHLDALALVSGIEWSARDRSGLERILAVA